MPAWLAAAALLAGCAAAGDPGTTPSRAGSTSSVVRYAYFTRSVKVEGTAAPVAGPLTTERDLPPAYKVFDSGQDKQVVFVAGINRLGHNFELRGVLKRPDGSVHSDFSVQKFVTTRSDWNYITREFPMERLASHPGAWTLDVFVDGAPVGTYGFTLRGTADVARLPAAPPAAAPAPAPPTVAPAPPPSAPPAASTPAPKAATPAPKTPPPAPRAAESKGSRWAVVIGVGRYEHRDVPPLRFAVSDADAMYTLLTTTAGFPKDHVLLLTDRTETKPTLRNIRQALGEFLARKAGPDDIVVIYYAGHGAPEVDASGAEADGLAKYLVPRDADPGALYSTAFPMDEVGRIFDRISAQSVVFFLDTCYSGAGGGRTFALAGVRALSGSAAFLERLTRSKGRVIISASRPNEVSLELAELGHGVFTYYLLEGLRGRADRNRDGVVTISELYEYVEEQVERKAREAGGRQHPIMRGDIEGPLPLTAVPRR